RCAPARRRPPPETPPLPPPRAPHPPPPAGVKPTPRPLNPPPRRWHPARSHQREPGRRRHLPHRLRCHRRIHRATRYRHRRTADRNVGGKVGHDEHCAWGHATPVSHGLVVEAELEDAQLSLALAEAEQARDGVRECWGWRRGGAAADPLASCSVPRSASVCTERPSLPESSPVLLATAGRQAGRPRHTK